MWKDGAYVIGILEGARASRLKTRDVNGYDNFRTKFVVEIVFKNSYPIYRNPADKDIRFRTEHLNMV
jgi:hypothetical protein